MLFLHFSRKSVALFIFENYCTFDNIFSQVDSATEIRKFMQFLHFFQKAVALFIIENYCTFDNIFSQVNSAIFFPGLGKSFH